MPLYESFREESTALIEAVVLNDGYWSRITSLPPKATQGSDIKVYENCSTKNRGAEICKDNERGKLEI